MRNFKQLLKKSAFAVMGILAISASQDISAQIAAGTAESNWGGSQAAVLNTGNYVANYGGSGQNLGVTVWDGTNPGLGWEYSGMSGTQTLLTAAINDPDVAMTYNGKCSAVVYESGGDIFLETYYFDPSIPGMVNMSGPAMVSNGTGTATNPNIDGGNTYSGVIVWSENVTGITNTYTRTVEICGGNLYPIVDISSPYSSAESIQPDVSIYELGGTEVYSYSYVDLSAGGNIFDLIYQVEEAAAITAGSISTVHYNIATTMHFFGGGETIQNPRIASQLGTGAAFDEASTIVFTITSGTGVFTSYYTWTYNTNSGISDLTTVTPNLNPCVNRQPVICWTTPGEYVAAWRYNGTCGGVVSTGGDLLSVKLDPLGVPVSTNVFSDYQWVNQAMAGNQRALSLASRYSVSAEILSGFYTSNGTQVLYKYTNSTASPYFRESSPEASDLVLNAYPNPVQDILSVEAKGMNSVALYNVSGQLLRSYGAADLAEKSVLQIQVSELPAGIYLLKANGTDQNYIEKISIQ